MSEEELSCPNCGSNQITGDKQGYGYGKGLAGGCLLGPLGLLAGGIGAKKLKASCLACGHTWEPGKENKEQTKTVGQTKTVENISLTTSDYQNIKQLITNLAWFKRTPYEPYAIVKHKYENKYDLVNLDRDNFGIVTDEDLFNMPELKEWFDDFIQ